MNQITDTATLVPGLIGRGSAERLASLASSIPANEAIVEIGVFLARTTCFLAAGAQSGHGAHVYGVDPWDLPGDRYPYKWVNHPNRNRRRIREMFTKPQTRLDAEGLIASHGLTDAVTLMRGFSVDVAREWAGPPVGLLFVDGDHREEMVRADWEAWKPHLVDGALVVWDDYHSGWPDVPRVVDDLVEQGAVSMVEVVARKNSALAVTRYEPA